MPLPIFTFNTSFNNIIIHTICTNQIRLKCIVQYEFDIYQLSYITSCRCMYMVVSVMIRLFHICSEIEHFRNSTLFCASSVQDDVVQFVVVYIGILTYRQ